MVEHFKSELRLGDIIDDYCVKCRRLTNHAIVSLVDGNPAKVRCRTCYNDHDYRNEKAPPTKKELKQQEDLYNAVLAGNAPAGDGAGPIPEPIPQDGSLSELGAQIDPVRMEIAAPEDAPPVVPVEAVAPVKNARGRAKRA